MEGFDRLCVSEKGTDRADMESLERLAAVGLVELRATNVDGRVLGMTACGPAASELANEISVIIENGLTVRELAKSLHSYPSHGYLSHRVALSITLSNTWGVLEACGPIGGLLAQPGRLITKSVGWAGNHVFRLPSRRHDQRRRSEWQAEGASQGVLLKNECRKTVCGTSQQESGDERTFYDRISRIDSFLEVHQNRKGQLSSSSLPGNEEAAAFAEWTSRCPE